MNPKPETGDKSDVRARLKRRDLLKAVYAAPILAPLILDRAGAAG